MRIAIYNRWLHTLGGGEREMAVLAQTLQAEHAVDLLTHQPADLRSIAERLHVDLPDVSLRVLPFDPDYRHVGDASREYDVFVNMSHGDLFTSRARHNLLRVFFPGRAAALSSSPVEPEVAQQSISLQIESGFYQPEAGGTRPFAWTGREAHLVLPTRTAPGVRPFRALELVVHGWRPPGVPPATVHLKVNHIPAGTREVPASGEWITWRVALSDAALSAQTLKVELQTTTFNPHTCGLGDDNRELGIAFAAVRLVDPRWWGRDVPGPDYVPDHSSYDAMLEHRAYLSAGSYDLLLANSRFTQEWITRRWGLRSEVLYPPVDLANLAPGPKQPRILSVGRFFAGSHNKKHLPMVEGFRALYDAGLRGWEYHLAGGCDEAMPEHRAYLEQVRAAAAGYPITLHVNAPFSVLRELYASSAIFWHATGLGEDEERDPERFEHFGISTVEAMAAGCVPVVLGKAGQLEIVADGVSGFLWQTLPELQSRTRALIDDSTLRSRMSASAQERSRAFATPNFAERVRHLLAQLDE